MAKFVYTANRINVFSGVPVSPALIFGSAHRAVAYAFGTNRDRKRDADRVSKLRKGETITTVGSEAVETMVLKRRCIL